MFGQFLYSCKLRLSLSLNPVPMWPPEGRSHTWAWGSHLRPLRSPASTPQWLLMEQDLAGASCPLSKTSALGLTTLPLTGGTTAQTLSSDSTSQRIWSQQPRSPQACTRDPPGPLLQVHFYLEAHKAQVAFQGAGLLEVARHSPPTPWLTSPSSQDVLAYTLIHSSEHSWQSGCC